MKRIAVLALLIFSGSAWSQECYEASIVSPSPMMGNNDEIIKLSDGTIWQVKYEYEYMYEYNPRVIVCPGRGKMGVKGKMLNVSYLGGRTDADEPRGSSVIESRIDGEFSGWEGETIFKLTNGQIWQQIDGRYKYKYKYGPKVILINRGRYAEMQVEGVDATVKVVRLK
jgi:hypothetical protein